MLADSGEEEVSAGNKMIESAHQKKGTSRGWSRMQSDQDFQKCGLFEFILALTG